MDSISFVNLCGSDSSEGGRMLGEERKWLVPGGWEKTTWVLEKAWVRKKIGAIQEDMDTISLFPNWCFFIHLVIGLVNWCGIRRRTLGL
jgi:hypothetical protein